MKILNEVRLMGDYAPSETPRNRLVPETEMERDLIHALVREAIAGMGEFPVHAPSGEITAWARFNVPCEEHLMKWDEFGWLKGTLTLRLPENKEDFFSFLSLPIHNAWFEVRYQGESRNYRRVSVFWKLEPSSFTKGAARRDFVGCAPMLEWDGVL